MKFRPQLFATLPPASFAGLVVLAIALASGLLSCDSGNPVVPESPAPPMGGSGAYSITLAAQPGQLQAGSGEPATVTVTVRDSAGVAPADGTVVTLSSDAGSFGVDSADAPMRTAQLALAGGRAQVSFFPGAEVGTANLLAKVGDSVGQLRLPIVEALPSNFFLTAVEPSSGSPDGGTTVRITGAGFQQPLRVTFGGVVAQVQSVTESSVVVVSPPSAAPVAAGQAVPVDVTVINALNDPESTADTLPGAFVYSREAIPTLFISEISPDGGSADGGTVAFLDGGGFAAPVQVTFGGAQATNVTVQSPSRIRLVTPPSPQPVAGGESLTVDVALINDLSGTQQQAQLPGGFRYDGGAAPDVVVVSAIAPDEGPFGGGTSVEITGSGFRHPVAVELGGIRQSSETFVNDTSVRFVTDPLSIGECPADGRVPRVGVKVTNLSSGVSGEAALTFTYVVPRPILSGVSPASGFQSGNLQVTLTGSDFAAPARVTFGIAGEQFAATSVSVGNGQVTARTPSVPITVFPEADCTATVDDGMGGTTQVAGKRYLDVVADVTLLHQGTGCSDTLPSAFTYRPNNSSCRPN